LILGKILFGGFSGRPGQQTISLATDCNLENLREEPDFKRLIANLEDKHTLANIRVGRST
jgi:hypothetical protein